MKTIKDIAKLAGVSTMTISRYFSAPEKLNIHTREKIKVLVNKYHYSPNVIAKSLITKKSGLIGVVVPDIRNPFFAQLYYRLETILEPKGYSLMLCNSKEDAKKERDFLRLLISRQVEGIILIPVFRENVESLIKRRKKFVLVERLVGSIQANMVSSAHYKGAYMAVEHLINLGHRNIAVLCGDTKLTPYHDRLKGYYDALKTYGIPLRKELVCESAINIESAEYSILNLIRKDQGISSLFSCNNLMSLGAINAIYESNLKIPENISFAAFDELPGIKYLIPSMTCVQQNSAMLAEIAVDLLMNQISKEESIPEQIEVPVTLKKGI